ncbi:prephenate dehydratase [Methanoplanus endosymbiosus]|uniref:ACT domain-containing protein n=1 Tax=Methanoplanus endosymbiosus TaxID=33865 RepID=A0A9E7PK13_9EURY|nr:prephenate dehydratase domain-containing protein [Methanoplanus endosymbiosus]UUX91338.1 ACT domain-containing protein [Methanoplanus endosymbiosus]
MKIAALGPEGTFSHELAVKISGDSEVVLFPTIKRVFAEAEKGECFGLVPVENSDAGGVGETLDGLMDTGCRIAAEYYMPIRHNLASDGVPAGGCRVLYAHPQSHAQCSRFIEDLGIPVIHTASNADSARLALQNPGSCAVTSVSAAKNFMLDIIRPDIQNSDNNITRFLLISPDKGEYPGGISEVRKTVSASGRRKCSIIIDPETDRPGLLYNILGVFAGEKINLTRIESRPSKRGIGSYVFFIDFEAESGEKLISSLKRIATVKELGCYVMEEV